MTQSTMQSRQSEGGFTLVELAIVMIIIGLLIGGILKGQELINNARTSSTVSQIKAVEAGIGTFRDKYAGLPGDITAPTNRLPNCTAGVCIVAGDADQKIELGNNAVNPGVAVTAAMEAGAAFPQLAAASMLGGISNQNATALGATTTNPTAPVGGTWQIGYGDGTAGTGLPATTGLLAGHYLVSVNTIGTAPGTGNYSMNAAQVSNIDSKLDDGAPLTGEVRAVSAAAGATSCIVAAGGTTIYNSSLSTVVCGLYAKVQ